MDRGGRITFLFTDIEGSTQLWEQHESLMPRILGRHDEILLGCLEDFGGRLIKHTGDGIFAAFEAGDPLRAALEMQRMLYAETWETIGTLRVRMALHAGAAERRGDDFFGPAINRTARVMAVGWGGQILLTPEAIEANPLPADTWLGDLGVHVLKDLSEPQPISMLCHADLIQAFPPLRSLSTHPNNLPQHSTPFIGRQDDLTHLHKLLASASCRVVTVIGPGGMGKTRLGLQAAADHLDEFRHGAYFVSLAPLSSPDYMASAVADALKFSLQAGDPKSQLLNYLNSKEMLLVMDNFEHVIEGASLVADIVQHAPKVHVIATSRERLNLQSECLYELAGLNVPSAPDATVFENFEAVELFITYAQRADPTYQLAPADKPAVIRICQLMNGMPLGIELAAAWVRTLPPAEIAAELEADLDFLATSMRDVPERHRSMRAVFEYSWNLLKPDEQAVYAKLSVFRGGFTRDAAMKVAGANLPTLAGLVDKSLLRRQPNGRYEIHELLRQYAEEKLEAQASVDTVKAAHSAYYCEQLGTLGEWFLSPREHEAVAIGEPEIENIRLAWRWATDHANVAHLAHANFGLESIYQYQARYLEAATTYEDTYQHLIRLEQTPEVRAAIADIEIMIGWFALRLGRFDRARQALEHSAREYAAFNYQKSVFGFHPLSALSVLETVTGNFAAAVAAGEELVRLSRERGDKGGLMVAGYALTGAYLTIGKLDAAKQHGEHALAIIHELGGTWFEAYIRNELGHVNRAMGDYEAAKAHYQASLRIRESFNDPEGVAAARTFMGETAVLQCDYTEAVRLLTQNLLTYEEIGDRGALARTLNGLGRAQLAEGNADAAKTSLRRALAIASEIEYVPLMLAVMVSHGEWHLDNGQAELGFKLLNYALSHPASETETKERARQQLAGHNQPANPAGDVPDIRATVADLLNELK